MIAAFGWRSALSTAIGRHGKEWGFSRGGTSVAKATHLGCRNRSSQSAAPPKGSPALPKTVLRKPPRFETSSVALLVCQLWQTALRPSPRKPGSPKSRLLESLPAEKVPNPHFSQRTREMGHPEFRKLTLPLPANTSSAIRLGISRNL